MVRCAFIFFLCLLCAASSVCAGVMDPSPRSFSSSPPDRADFSRNETLFFCPLNKKFYNDSDQVAVQTILLESLGEGYSGMVAVGEVIRNRSRFFSKDPAFICKMPKQFSCWNDEKRAEQFLHKYRAFYFIAWVAWIHSQGSLLTAGATDYHADSIHPYWADSYRAAARIGKHVFYTRPLSK